MAFGKSYRKSYRQKRSGGFSRRVPILGIRVPSLFIWAAVVGGGIYFFKGQLQPLFAKFQSLTGGSSTNMPTV